MCHSKETECSLVLFTNCQSRCEDVTYYTCHWFWKII